MFLFVPCNDIYLLFIKTKMCSRKIEKKLCNFMCFMCKVFWFLLCNRQTHSHEIYFILSCIAIHGHVSVAFRLPSSCCDNLQAATQRHKNLKINRPRIQAGPKVGIH